MEFLNNISVKGKQLATEEFVDNQISAAISGSTVTVDSELSETSENPVQNKVITEALAAIKPTNITYGTQDLVAGESELPNGTIYLVYEE